MECEFWLRVGRCFRKFGLNHFKFALRLSRLQETENCVSRESAGFGCDMNFINALHCLFYVQSHIWLRVLVLETNVTCRRKNDTQQQIFKEFNKSLTALANPC